MKKFFLCLFFPALLLLAGCKSPTESKGIQDILSYYGGSLTWSKGFVTKSEKEGGTKTYFQIILNKTNIRKYFKTAELPASNCAWLFYRALTEKEKSQYTFIRVILPEYAPTEKYEFQVTYLRAVERSLPALQETVECLKEKDLHKLVSLFNPAIHPDTLNIGGMQAYIQKVDSMAGNIQRMEIQGFLPVTAEIDGRNVSLLRLSGMLVGDKENVSYSVTVDPDGGKQKLYGYMFRK